MAKPIYSKFVQTSTGAADPSASFTVVNEETGLDVDIYSDRAGTTVITPPYFADSSGLIRFYYDEGITIRIAVTGASGSFTDRYQEGRVFGGEPGNSPRILDFQVDSISQLPPATGSGRKVSVTGYHDSTTVGGGEFVDAGPARHDGGRFIDPNRTFPTDPNNSAEVAAWFADSGVNALCWERLDNLMSPHSWGVRAGGAQNDSPYWKKFLDYYKSKTVVLSPAGGSLVYTAPKILPISGVSELGERLDLPDYLEADFSRLIFRRHSSWSEPAGRFMLRFPNIYLANFGGLTIENEDEAIQFINPNFDKTKIFVSGLHLTSCDNAVEVTTQSTAFTFTDFRIDNCPRFLKIIRCDRFLLTDGWITQGPLTNQYDATIRVENANLVVRDVLGVPVPHTGSEVAWINNIEGRVDIRDFRAGGEPGACTLVNNFAEYRLTSDDDNTPLGVKINHSQCYSVDTQGGTQTSCVVRLFKLPNFIEYADNRGHDITEEVITWGSTASQTAQINGLTSQLKNFSYKYENILEQGAIHAYPDNLSGLFGAGTHYSLYGVTGVAGQLVIDTRIRPRSGQVYELVLKGNNRAITNSQFASAWCGKVLVASGLESGVAKRNIKIFNSASSGGGNTFVSDFTVSVVYWDGASESDYAPVGDDDYRIRIKVGNWEAGAEGAGFSGYIKQLL